MTTSNRVVDAILPEPVVFHLVLLPLDDLFHRQTIASRCRDHDHTISMHTISMHASSMHARRGYHCHEHDFFQSHVFARSPECEHWPRIPHRSFHVFRDCSLPHPKNSCHELQTSLVLIPNEWSSLIGYSMFVSSMFVSSMFFCLPLSDRYFPAQSLRHKTILLFANSTFPRPFGYKPHLLIKIALNCS